MFVKWIKAAGLRAVKTVAQTACSLIAVEGVTIGFSDVEWIKVASASLLAGVLSLLTSVAGLPEVKEDEGKAAE